MLMQHGMYRHDNTGGAKAALQSMLLLESLLDGVQIAIGSSHTLNGRHYHAIGLHCEHQARAHGLTVQQYSTATTDAMFAANMRTREMKIVAKKIRKKQAHRHALFGAMTIDGHCNIRLLGEDRSFFFLLLHSPYSPFFLVSASLPGCLEHPPGQFRSEHAPVLDGGMHIAHVVTHKCTCGFGCCIEGRVIELRTNEDVLHSMTPHRETFDAKEGDMRRRTMVIGRRGHYDRRTTQQ